MHWKPIAPVDENGKRRYKCTLCSLRTGPTIYGPEKIHCSCRLAIGWGDMIKRRLSGIGIKQQGCGGCGRRQQAFNQVGWSITGMVMSTGRYLRDTITSAIRNP